MEALIAFLHARLDEDAAAAHAATPGPWWYNAGKQWLEGESFESYDLTKGLEFVGYGGPHPFTGAVAGTGPADDPQSMADAAHIARHDPARALRGAEALRSLLHAYERPETSPELPDSVNTLTTAIQRQVLEKALRLLAIAYNDHPDYRPEWAPTT
ncbi:DUF6221 family protein [Streptomyces hydrogenans]|uniref:DUF6221 family protein n=1 Tax=Streptomyces hydrogenans TaxID=1873719 RepID=UPI0036BC1C2F